MSPDPIRPPEHPLDDETLALVAAKLRDRYQRERLAALFRTNPPTVPDPETPPPATPAPGPNRAARRAAKRRNR